MKRIKNILEKVLNGIDLSFNDFIYLQEHLKEVQETHNIELIKLATSKEDCKPSFKFNKII